MYRITDDARAAMIEVEVGGFWSLDDVARFAVDLRRSIATVHAAHGRHRVLYDYSSAAIQSQEVIAALRALARDLETPAERIALYTDGRFARLQAGRIAAVRDGIRLFDDRIAALAWLREPAIAPAGGLRASR